MHGAAQDRLLLAPIHLQENPVAALEGELQAAEEEQRAARHDVQVLPELVHVVEVEAQIAALHRADPRPPLAPLGIY